MSDQPPAVHIAGYTVIETCHKTENGPYAGLAFGVRDEEGEILETSPDVHAWPDEPEFDVQRDRLWMLMDAVCRYYNTRAQENFKFNWSIIDEINHVFQSLPDMSWPEGWKLCKTEGTEHYFVKEEDGKKQYLRVVEGQFTEALSERDFYELQTGKRAPIMIDTKTFT